MQPVVETLSGLERRVDLAVAVADIEKEVQAQLKRMVRTAKVPGFRPGKAPLAMLERSHGPGIRYDVINEQVGRAFERVVTEANLRVAGTPRLEPKTEGAPEDTLAFTATFEVYPEVAVPDLSSLSVNRAVIEITDAEVDRTIEVLRKQRVTYEPREGRAAEDGDRVTLDFAGTIDGVPFEGGKAESFPFVLGQGRMLPEFEAAAKGMKAGESKTFPLAFPADYGGKEVAGKTAEFAITIKEVAEPRLPEVDAEFAKSLGQAEGDVAKLREDIRANIEREAKVRTQSRTKASVMTPWLRQAPSTCPRPWSKATPTAASPPRARNSSSAACPTPIRCPSRPKPSRPNPSAACAWGCWCPSWSSRPSCKSSPSRFAPA